jgi:hypothetical protein
MHSNNLKAFVAFVDDLFWNEWDPIGVNQLGGEKDEYSGYAVQIASMAWNNKDTQSMLDYMYKSASETMGLNFTRSIADAYNMPIIEKIIQKLAVYKQA